MVLFSTRRPLRGVAGIEFVEHFEIPLLADFFTFRQTRILSHFAVEWSGWSVGL